LDLLEVLYQQLYTLMKIRDHNIPRVQKKFEPGLCRIQTKTASLSTMAYVELLLLI